jgi:hypothetical protein
MPPAQIRDVIPRIVPEELLDNLMRPLAWIAVSLPAGVSKVDESIQGVTINAVTASNIEVMSQEVSFEARNVGKALAVRPEGAQRRFLLGARSILGETNEPYVPEGDLRAPPGTGQYRIDGDQITLRPGQRKTGRFDRSAHLRLLFTDGARGNNVRAGRVSRITRLANPIAQITSLTDSLGGMNPPDYGLRRERLAEILRSRERAVTPEDFHVLVRAIEPRVKRVDVTFSASVMERRLQPVHVVTVTVSRRDFSTDASLNEFPRLREMLERHLAARTLVGQVVRVVLEEVV